eukprot:2555293-Pleurochrysis_carterae.AAC.1
MLEYRFKESRICRHRHGRARRCCISVCTPFKAQPLLLSAFCAQFIHSNSAILQNKNTRFSSFLIKSSNGTLFQKPSTKPRFVAHLSYHELMWGLLRSSYDDVEAELNTLRNRHLEKNFLSIIRINHLIKDHPDIYLDSAPFIIPVQGESPYGVYHLMHAGWRLYIRLLRVCAVALCGLRQSAVIWDDPPVKAYNTSIYFCGA